MKFRKPLLPIRINTLAKFPQIVADFCGLLGTFTSHAIIWSSATILADSGATIIQLKRFERWKSNLVAIYGVSSERSKIEVMGLNGRKVTKLDIPKQYLSTINLNSNSTNCAFYINKSWLI